MKELMKDCKNNILDFLLKYNFVIATIINIIIIVIFYEYIINYFEKFKNNLLDMLISISGTLFGFILTFLSIFIVFKTDEKYKKNDENYNEPLILLINNSSFNSIYELFIKSSFSLGLLLIVSIIYYFTSYGLHKIVNSLFIFAIFELMILCIVRVFLSIYTFNTLINILINNKDASKF